MATVEILGAECRAGGAVNDDALGCTAQAAWVIDGATSIGRSVLGVESDARWLAQAVDRHLRLLLEVEPEQSGETLLRRLLNDIQGDFRAQSGRDWHDLEDMPAACLSLLRIRGGEIELLNIGDSRILVEGADGQVRSFGDSALHELDRQSLAHFCRMREEHPQWDHAELFKASRPRVRQNRLLMNKPEGYWALDISDRWLGQVQRETLPLAALRSFVLMTDGFDRLVEPFRRYTDEQLLRRLEDVGVSAMLDELREIEQGDDQALAFPRFKIHDDASALWGRIAG
ncbi:TPA: protein phosphatase 2C domain-containing protein [Pseudomonas aeruginosa]|nr:protein phosphatase 2C domain-containing protein [Pseudomonas aeruginosa]